MWNTAFLLLTSSFVSRQPETTAPLSIEVGTPPTGFIHVEVNWLLIKLCGLPSDASFSNSFPAWFNKQLIHLLLPSYKLVAMTLNTRSSRWKGGDHGQWTDCRGVQLLVCINLHSKAVFILNWKGFGRQGEKRCVGGNPFPLLCFSFWAPLNYSHKQSSVSQSISDITSPLWVHHIEATKRLSWHWDCR